MIIKNHIDSWKHKFMKDKYLGYYSCKICRITARIIDDNNYYLMYFDNDSREWIVKDLTCDEMTIRNIL